MKSWFLIFSLIFLSCTEDKTVNNDLKKDSFTQCMESSKECAFVDIEHVKSKVAYEKGCLASDDDACLSLAQYYEVKEANLAKAKEIYQDFCDEGNNVACDMLAAMEVAPKAMGKKVITQETYKNTKNCKTFYPVFFKAVKEDVTVDGKVYKNYEYYKTRINDYELWAGDMPNRIRNLKTGKECEAEVPGIVWPRYEHSKVVFKTDCDDVLMYDSYSGSEGWLTLVDMKTCKAIFEVKTSMKNKEFKNLLSEEKYKKYKTMVEVFLKERN